MGSVLVCAWHENFLQRYTQLHDVIASSVRLYTVWTNVRCWVHILSASYGSPDVVCQCISCINYQLAHRMYSAKRISKLEFAVVHCDVFVPSSIGAHTNGFQLQNAFVFSMRIFCSVFLFFFSELRFVYRVCVSVLVNSLVNNFVRWDRSLFHSFVQLKLKSIFQYFDWSVPCVSIINITNAHVPSDEAEFHSKIAHKQSTIAYYAGLTQFALIVP